MDDDDNHMFYPRETFVLCLRSFRRFFSLCLFIFIRRFFIVDDCQIPLSVATLSPFTTATSGAVIASSPASGYNTSRPSGRPTSMNVNHEGVMHVNQLIRCPVVTSRTPSCTAIVGNCGKLEAWPKTLRADIRATVTPVVVVVVVIVVVYPPRKNEVAAFRSISIVVYPKLSSL